MKKLLAVAIIAALALALAGCQEEYSTDPLVAKWVLQYNEGKSQVYFSFEAIGDLEVVIWHYDETTQKLEQAEDYIGTYTVDEQAGTITYLLDGQTYVFGYSIEEKVALTLTFEDKTLVVPYVEANKAK